MTRLPRLLIGLWIGLFAMPAMAQDADAPIQRLLQDHGEIISESAGRKKRCGARKRPVFSSMEPNPVTT